MSSPALARRLVYFAWLLCSAPACIAPGLVGEGSACPDGCPSGEVCVAGACVVPDAGVAGMGGGGGHGGEDEDEDENEEDEDEEPPDDER